MYGFNTNRLLRWRLIIEEYGTYIEYIKSEKNMVSDALSIFAINRNQETTQKSTYLGPTICKHGNLVPWATPVVRVPPWTSEHCKMPYRVRPNQDTSMAMEW